MIRKMDNSGWIDLKGHKNLVVNARSFHCRVVMSFVVGQMKYLEL